jgi:hypothetical protein
MENIDVILNSLVNLRIQIAKLKVEELALTNKLELKGSEHKVHFNIHEPIVHAPEKRKYVRSGMYVGRFVRKEGVGINVTPRPRTKRRKPKSYYHRKKIGERCKNVWASYTPEQRAKRILAAKMGHRKHKK